MRKLFWYLLLFPSGILLFQSCTGGGSKRSYGPIVLGDSSTIVTETDPQYLKDNIADFQSQRSAEAPVSRDTVAQSPAGVPADTVAAAPAPTSIAPQPAPVAAANTSAHGLEVPFKGLTVSVPGINVRSFKPQDPANVNGVSYSLLNGKLNGNYLQAKGATVTKVLQRYQTVVILNDRESGKILLQALGKYSSGWQPLTGSGGRYLIAGLDKNQIQFNNVSAGAIHNAVAKAARSNRLNKKEEAQLQKKIKNIRTVHQSPFSIVLQNVVWRISARDASGKNIEKEIRIDLPVE